MDLSLIIDCPDKITYIAPLLNSLHLQEIYNYKVELIFVVNQFNKIASMINAWSEYHQNLHIQIIESNYNNAYNTGLKQASGRYVWFLSSNIWMTDIHSISSALDFLNRYHPKYAKFNRAANQNEYLWQYICLYDYAKKIADINFENCVVEFLNPIKIATKLCNCHDED